MIQSATPQYANPEALFAKYGKSPGDLRGVSIETALSSSSRTSRAGAVYSRLAGAFCRVAGWPFRGYAVLYIQPGTRSANKEASDVIGRAAHQFNYHLATRSGAEDLEVVSESIPVADISAEFDREFDRLKESVPKATLRIGSQRFEKIIRVVAKIERSVANEEIIARESLMDTVGPQLKDAPLPTGKYFRYVTGAMRAQVEECFKNQEAVLAKGVSDLRKIGLEIAPDELRRIVGGLDEAVYGKMAETVWKEGEEIREFVNGDLVKLESMTKDVLTWDAAVTAARADAAARSFSCIQDTVEDLAKACKRDAYDFVVEQLRRGASGESVRKGLDEIITGAVTQQTGLLLACRISIDEMRKGDWANLNISDETVFNVTSGFGAGPQDLGAEENYKRLGDQAYSEALQDNVKEVLSEIKNYVDQFKIDSFQKALKVATDKVEAGNGDNASLKGEITVLLEADGLELQKNLGEIRDKLLAYLKNEGLDASEVVEAMTAEVSSDDFYTLAAGRVWEEVLRHRPEI